MKKQASENSIFSVIESNIGVRKSGKASHTRNWMKLVQKDAEVIWNTNAWT